MLVENDCKSELKTCPRHLEEKEVNLKANESISGNHYLQKSDKH